MVRARRVKADPEKKRRCEKVAEVIYSYFEGIKQALESYDEAAIIEILFELSEMGIVSLIVSHEDVVGRKRTEEQVLDELLAMLKKEVMEEIRAYNHDKEGNEGVLH